MTDDGICPNCGYDKLTIDDKQCPICHYTLVPTNWPLVVVIAVLIGATIIGALVWAIPKPSPAVKSPPAPASAPEGGMTTQEIVRLVQPAVVTVHVPDLNRSGSGWGWQANKYVITNAHVVDGARRVVLVTADHQQIAGTVVGIDAQWDVGVVRLDDGAHLPALPVAAAGKTQTGDEVLAFGSPLGLDKTVTDGIISAFRSDVGTEYGKLPRALQTSAAIAPGSSGGPLVNRASGTVVGMNTAGVTADKASNIGFAVPVDAVVEAAQRVVAGK